MCGNLYIELIGIPSDRYKMIKVCLLSYLSKWELDLELFEDNDISQILTKGVPSIPAVRLHDQVFLFDEDKDIEISLLPVYRLLSQLDARDAATPGCQACGNCANGQAHTTMWPLFH